MEVILIKDVDKLGKSGSVVKVKDGFARNFLFPRVLAILANPANLKKIQQDKEREDKVRQQENEKSKILSDRLNEMSITISVATHDEDKLYGSISASDIIKALNQEGISGVAEQAVILDEPIKSVGVYDVVIRLRPEISARIKVWVVKG
jgi:large subunit ribosomal protein L9